MLATRRRCGSWRAVARRSRPPWQRPGWTASVTTSTTCTDRPRSARPPWRHPRICELHRAPPVESSPAPTVEIVGERGERVPTGETGLIVVGSDAQFTEYTGGGTKERIRGLMSSGDVGHFDADGRLFVTGRADDMIVSGGENVFPLEIEEVLLSHDDVVDAARGRCARRRVRPTSVGVRGPRSGRNGRRCRDEGVRRRPARAPQGAPGRHVRRGASPEHDGQAPAGADTAPHVGVNVSGRGTLRP